MEAGSSAAIQNAVSDQKTAKSMNRWMKVHVQIKGGKIRILPI